MPRRLKEKVNNLEENFGIETTLEEETSNGMGDDDDEK